MTTRDTAREEETGVRGVGGAAPGVVVVFCGGAPVVRAIPLVGGEVTIGRADSDGDALVSRAHVEVRRLDGVWTVRDLDSRNGTHVDGALLHQPYSGPMPRVIRIGGMLLAPHADVTRFRGASVVVGADLVAGPGLREVLAQVDDAARRSDSLLIEGESGTGKELLASRFHAMRGPEGAPLVAVNCSAIPTGMAERLFLGSRRGAYSGATSDAIGYVEAADGGVLFLDEIGELELALQAKLLRVLETHEVMPLGATTGKRVRLAVCFATHRDLAARVAEGQFRADLYYRIAQSRVSIPPLRARSEEIPFLIAGQLERSAGARLSLHAKVVEACLLRTWPGNVRELIAEVREGAARARRAGDDRLRLAHLASSAGEELSSEVIPRPRASTHDSTGSDDGGQRQRIVAALETHAYNVRAAADALGMHRTQLYRTMRQLGIEVARRLRAPQG